MATQDHNQQRGPVLGCIADDVTGATDLAINLVHGGLCAIQVFGIPTAEELCAVDANAVVIALKTRSIPTDKAITASLKALSVLKNAGVQRFFFKYCSTFDSTKEGNIGPVAVALLDALDASQTIFCPALPRNGRTVYQGHLFVHGRLLHESGMEQHPLNPMTDANLVRWLGKQTCRRIGLLSYEDLVSGAAQKRLDELRDNGTSLVITDSCDDGQLESIARATVDMPLLTGGAGIARFLPEAYRSIGLFESVDYTPELPEVSGRGLILSGSCSTTTNRQVAWMQSRCPNYQIDVRAVVVDFENALAELAAWANDCAESESLMIYSTATAQQVAELQTTFGATKVAEAIEGCFAVAAARLVPELGIGRLIVAGGETSGAVVQELGVRSIRIGPEICPGVPWTEAVPVESTGGRPLALALKSGNFGDEDFFERALEMLR